MITLLSLALLAGPSLADVVNPAPEDCPPGARGTSSHAGEWCEATDCGDDPGVCGEEQSCEEVSLCVETREYQPGGMWPDTAEPPTYTTDEAHGACDPDGDACEVGECQTAMRCVDEGALKQACGGCAAPVSPLGLSMALAGLGLLLGRRRR